jgi:type II secretory pathway pseudopilin PulG
MMELCVAAAILALLLPMVAQLALWSLTQRMHAQSQQAALELAQNVLESARACPLEDLNASWASAQKIPDQIALLLPDGKLTVTIEPEKNGVRRVTVSITWQNEIHSPRQVQLVTLVSTRGGKKS